MPHVKNVKFYRNKFSISSGNEIVEPHSLWELRGEQLVLVDEDENIVLPFTKENKKLFYSSNP